MMIQAVIFDFGGVLVRDLFARQRLAAYDALLGWSAGTLFERLYSGRFWETVSTGGCTLDEFWAEVGAPVADRLPDEFGKFRDSFYGEVLDAAMVRLAWRLRRRYRVALLSNATVLLPERLARTPELEGLFDVSVISALEGLRKPDPAIYHLTCRRLRLAPQVCVFVDDKARNTDIALTLGMAAVEHKDAVTTTAALRSLGMTF